MSISLRARLWRFLLRSFFKESRPILSQNRARIERTAELFRVPADVGVEKINLDGIPALWIRPAGVDKTRVMLYLHGGGYVTGSPNGHLMMCVPMAQTLQMNVLLPAYRLAPEHPFPAAVDDARKAYRWLLGQGFQPEKIVIAGDSAGGGLSLTTTLALRDAGEPLPAAVVAISPWTDLTHAGQSHFTLAEPEAVLKTDVLKEWALLYAGDAANLVNPLVSPIFADFHGFPPLMIQAGSEEVLLDDSRLLAEKARAEGVSVTLKVWDGLWHVWHALGDLIPESRMAFDEISQFVEQVLAMQD
jgi:acetyl esterase/lipase